MTDNRRPWEVEYCLRVKFAASYIDIMQSTGQRRIMLQGAYNSTDDLDGWCKRRIQGVMTQCEKLTDENGPLSTDALIVAQPWLEKVQQMG